MNILAIDPGPEKSGFLLMENDRVVEAGHEWNAAIFEQPFTPELVLIENVESFGMAVGRNVLETMFFVGAFYAFYRSFISNVYRIDRSAVKLALCNNRSAKPGNVRQAIIDRYPRIGGGKIPQIGIKKNPGPLYGVSGHAWSALALIEAWKIDPNIWYKY